ncbi:MAG: hypothetical protein ACLFWD_08185 [Anaerolineales bacterium]
MIFEISGEQWLDLGIVPAAVAAAIMLIRLLTNVLLRRLVQSLVDRTETELDGYSAGGHTTAAPARSDDAGAGYRRRSTAILA